GPTTVLMWPEHDANSPGAYGQTGKPWPACWLGVTLPGPWPGRSPIWSPCRRPCPPNPPATRGPPHPCCGGPPHLYYPRRPRCLSPPSVTASGTTHPDVPACSPQPTASPCWSTPRTCTRSRPMSPSKPTAPPGLTWPSGTRSGVVGPDVPASSSTTTATTASPPGIGTTAWPQTPQTLRPSRGGDGTDQDAPDGGAPTASTGRPR